MTCCLLSLLMFLAIIANNMDLRGEQSDHGSYCFAVMKKTSLKCTTVKRVLSGHSKRRKLIFKTDYRLMQVKSIAECSKGTILQYFGPSLSYHLSLRSLFCLFLSGHLRPVLLYICSIHERQTTFAGQKIVVG